MKKTLILFFTLFCYIQIIAQNSPYNHHSLSVQFNISESFIDVTDSIQLSGTEMNEFYLNSNLTIYESNYELEENGFAGNYKKYIVSNEANNILVIKYKGVIANNKEGIQHITHANMFESTNGIIFEKGIYLSGETYWVPYFKDANLRTFSINLSIPKDWLFVTQGELISEKLTDSLKTYKFQMNKPTNQVCLIGNKWTKYSRNIRNVDINVYLINDDEYLANKYLDATSEYLRLYDNIIGSFPYHKFDVIENFWETGYGMPSFTLLGKKVMRFPWIISTSYPHELLHNYWGNGVYVNYEEGNWSEGITTYMADHLLKEKSGDGAIFRREQLKKYSDYVNPGNDFPVREFGSKTNAESEAIGYSKVLMVNHMLRIKYGTDLFLKAYQDFYENNQFKVASFTDIQHSFEKVSGDKLDSFFNQWINATGAPTIELNKVKLKKKKGQYSLNFTLSQQGIDKTFELNIPVYVYLEDKKTVERKLLTLNEKTQSYNLNFSEKPVRIDIDPMFDVMRILDSQEVPPTLSQILGSDKWTVILPKSSKSYFYYKNFAISWSNIYSRQGKEIEIVNDNKIEEIPDNNSVWILGAENKFAGSIQIKDLYSSSVHENIFEKIDSLNANELVLYTLPNPKNTDETIGYINGNKPETLGQLNMKLMHYGNFSYLGFEGKSLENSLKGNFPALGSPLNYIINKKDIIDWSEYKFPKADVMYR